VLHRFVFAVSSCVLPEQQRQTGLFADQGACAQMGERYSSPAHTNCMFQQQQRRDDGLTLFTQEAYLASETARHAQEMRDRQERSGVRKPAAPVRRQASMRLPPLSLGARLPPRRWWMEAAIEPSKIEQARLAVSRVAADLFWMHGVEGTSGDAIAEAAGISKRTVWRYFRSKEACVEPLFLATELRFITLLEAWPSEQSIETYLHATIGALTAGEQEQRDAIAAARLIAMLAREPALRSTWLMACAQAEAQVIPIVARRAGRLVDDFEVRLCAATIIAGTRVVDETISSSALNAGRVYTSEEVTSQLAAAIRTASTLPICDPVA
jgi:AcrR family transcriptional regulator